MRKSIISILALALGGCAAVTDLHEVMSGATSKYVAQHDAFTDVESYQWVALAGFDRQPRIGSYMEGSSGSVVMTVSFREGADRPFWRCHETNLLVDGKRLATRASYDPGSIVSGGSGAMRFWSSTESVTFIVDLATAAEIANAAEVRGKTCWLEYRMLKRDQEGLAKVITKAKE